MSKTLESSLYLEKLVKDQTDYLIGKVEEIEPLLTELVARSKREPFGNSQIRNLLAASKNATGVKEVKLYIEYQMSRENAWKLNIRGKNIGDAIKKILDDIDQRSKEVATQDVSQKELVVKLMERFFFYWSWKYKYINQVKPKYEDNNRSSQQNNRGKNQGHKRGGY